MIFLKEIKRKQDQMHQNIMMQLLRKLYKN